MTHDCYAVFGPAGKPVWYTIRPTKDESVNVFGNANRVKRLLGGDDWDAGYSCRPVRLAERKDEWRD